MKLIIGIASLLILSMTSIAQKRANQIEVNPYFRWDWYPKFTYSTNSVNSNTVKIIGRSFGITASYKILVQNRLYLKAGLGYYKYAFSKIDQVNSLFGKTESRVIKETPPGGSSTFSYATRNYWYNTLSAVIGTEKVFNIKKRLEIIVGVNITNYYTFTQHYILGSQNYKKSVSRYFGFSTDLYVGIQKKYGKITISPIMILPIYTNWKQDKIFPQEDNNKHRNKWLRGVGIGIIFSRSLTKM